MINFAFTEDETAALARLVNDHSMAAVLEELSNIAQFKASQASSPNMVEHWQLIAARVKHASKRIPLN
jgi:hypothetical protein